MCHDAHGWRKLYQRKLLVPALINKARQSSVWVQGTQQALYAKKRKGVCRFSPGERVPQDRTPRAIRVIVDRGLTTRNRHLDTIGSDQDAAV